MIFNAKMKGVRRHLMVDDCRVVIRKILITLLDLLSNLHLVEDFLAALITFNIVVFQHNIASSIRRTVKIVTSSGHVPRYSKISCGHILRNKRTSL